MYVPFGKSVDDMFWSFKTKQSYEESPPGQGIHPES